MKGLLMATALPVTSSAAFSEMNAMCGKVITAEIPVDVAKMIRIADAIDSAVDVKDGALVRSNFTDEITVDFLSLVGGEPATIRRTG